MDPTRKDIDREDYVWFGSSVAITGNEKIDVISISSGYARDFERCIGSCWKQLGGDVIFDGPLDWFAYTSSFAMSEDRRIIVVGGSMDD
eukprot:scaffold842_cov287-Chaetoceros_neogracile.AAC.20